MTDDVQHLLSLSQTQLDELCAKKSLYWESGDWYIYRVGLPGHSIFEKKEGFLAFII